MHVLAGRNHGSVFALDFNVDGSHLAIGGGDATIRILDTTTYNFIYTIGCRQSRITALTYSPDGRMLAAGGNINRHIHIFDTTTYKYTKTLDGHTSGINALAFSTDSSMILSASQDKTIRGWDMTSMMQVYVWNDYSDTVTSVAVSPDGAWFASGSEDKSVRIWGLGPSKAVLDSIKPVFPSQINESDDDGINLYDKANIELFFIIHNYSYIKDYI